MGPDSHCTALVDSGYRVIRFDNRDTGKSTWSKASPGADLLRMVQSGFGRNDQVAYTIGALADDVFALTVALKIERARVVGIFLGGSIAEAAGMRHPQRTAALVSMMSITRNPGLLSSTPAAMTALMTPPREPFVVAAVTELAQSQRRVIGSPGYAMPDDYVRDGVALNFKRGNNPEGVLRQLLASVRAGDWRTRLSTLNVPKLVMYGRDDPLIPFAAGENCARSIPRAKLLLIDDWGHNMPPLIRPLVAREVGTFFNEIA